MQVSRAAIVDYACRIEDASAAMRSTAIAAMGATDLRRALVHFRLLRLRHSGVVIGFGIVAKLIP